MSVALSSGADCASKRGSSKTRKSNTSSISSSEKAETMAPLWGSINTRPSASSWNKASRTGMRLTWKLAASASWRNGSPAA